MAEEHEQLMDAAFALDGTIIGQVISPSPADDVPEDATDVPQARHTGAERFPTERKRD